MTNKPSWQGFADASASNADLTWGEYLRAVMLANVEHCLREIGASDLSEATLTRAFAGRVSELQLMTSAKVFMDEGLLKEFVK